MGRDRVLVLSHALWQDTSAATPRLLPSMGLLRRDPAGHLRDVGRGSVGAGGRGARKVLIAAGIALACVLVTGAGLLARSLAERTREIGIRMALGASPRMVFRVVLAQGGWLVVTGSLIGLGGGV